MVTAVTSIPKQRPSQNQKRPPLLPSDSDNAPPRRPRAREVTSRYLSLSTSSSSSSSNSSSSTNTTLSSITSGSSISSGRAQSPMLGGRTAITTPKSQLRAVSAERRRPAAAPPSSAEKMLVTSMRSLSVSFQGESYSIPVSKVKPPPAAVGTPSALRKGTPERRKAGVTPTRDRRERDIENSRPSDHHQLQQHRWPGRLRREDSSFLTRSLDYGSERVKCSGSGAALKEFRKSVGEENSSDKVGNDLKLETNDVEVRGIGELENRPRSGSSLNLDVESTATTQLRGGPRAVVVPQRCWQETNRVNKVRDPASPLPISTSNRTIGPSKLVLAKKFQNDSPVSSPREVSSSRGISPLRGGVRAASPCKALSSSSGSVSRGMASPTRARSGVGNSMNENNTCSTPSVLRFAVDARRGNSGENQMADAHVLRLLYNRLLQWRLANARVENTLLAQKHTAERSLYNAWVTTTKLRHSVKSKAIELQSLRQNLKLYSILKEQDPHLQSWSLLDRDHCDSVSGGIKALEASTVRLPIIGGARADVQKVQEAISSSVDVMQAMASSICFLLTKVEQMNSLVAELTNVSAREHCLLDECKDFLSTTLIPLQVLHCSLRTQVMQVQREPTNKS
ncbi:hypothetical protein ABFS82_03G036200 [Erythranthe guttata]|uniref:QWRF motif-containing protein 2 n=1 Tax=Erythranthe guttata TaxID=4155 RepID=UPI00064D7DDD|nr:PREDICTED: QWRF motif-containing protein 2 [Erythranthe guttata]|eukprot:XP_012851705.1 PREDICTED: QWRF motif-containing protein 2 [Erythranthe guttata]